MRLIKSPWAKETLANGEPNPDFKESVEGPDVIEGCNFTSEFIQDHNQRGYNIYFFPNHPSRDVYAEGVKHLSGKHIDVFNFIFADMDLKDGIYATKQDFVDELNLFSIKPTMIVDSGNGIHAYWRISDLTRDSYVFLQLALIKRFKTDESVFTVMQLMRVPSYLNTKRHKDYVLANILEDSSGLVYQVADFKEITDVLGEESAIRGQNHLNKLDGKLKINLPEYVNVDELPDKFIDLINDIDHNNIHALFTNPKEAYGDRSGADMKLANNLYKLGFNKKETLAVICNTEKALSKGGNRLGYAQMTVDKVYTDKLNDKFLTVAQKLRIGSNDLNLGDPVNGTHFLDYSVLKNPWRKKEVLGLIAGAGVGKTSISLKIIKDIIENNQDNDDVFIFFSLEMPEADIVERWIRLVGGANSPLADRLYVISNEDPRGRPRDIGLQEVYEYTTYIKKTSGKNVGCVCIDHIGILSRHIDLNKNPKFGIESEQGAGNGNIRTLSLGALARQLKNIATSLNTFLIVQTQTTKEKGIGDIPIQKDGAFGTSDFENIADRIITIWQPLMRVQHLTELCFLAWQYVKIRNKHKEDGIKVYQPKLLTFNMNNGDLNVSTHSEYVVFKELFPQANAAREAMLKKKSDGYSIHAESDNIRPRDLKLVK
jgi:hypothetical protein